MAPSGTAMMKLRTRLTKPMSSVVGSARLDHVDDRRGR